MIFASFLPSAAPLIKAHCQIPRYCCSKTAKKKKQEKEVEQLKIAFRVPPVVVGRFYRLCFLAERRRIVRAIKRQATAIIRRLPAPTDLHVKGRGGGRRAKQLLGVLPTCRCYCNATDKVSHQTDNPVLFIHVEISTPNKKTLNGRVFLVVSPSTFSY